MDTFLVTGGAGFIGSHLVTALVDRGNRVRVLDNFSTGYRHNLKHLGNSFKLLEGDLLDRRLVAKAVVGVDCIFHQAALASVPRSVKSPLESHAACATGTATLLDEARRNGVRRIVYAASSSAYGNQPSSPKREIDLPAPRSPYAAAKLAGEYYCHAFGITYGLETVSIRYFNVFGPRQDPRSEYSAVIPRFVTSILSGKPPTIFGDGKQSRDFTFVDNVIRANLLAAASDRAVGKTFNIACGRQINLLQLIASINQVLGLNVKPVHTDPRPGDVRESLADIGLARKLLDYEPYVQFDEGLRRSVDFYRSLLT